MPKPHVWTCPQKRPFESTGPGAESSNLLVTPYSTEGNTLLPVPHCLHFSIERLGQRLGQSMSPYQVNGIVSTRGQWLKAPWRTLLDFLWEVREFGQGTKEEFPPAETRGKKKPTKIWKFLLHVTIPAGELPLVHKRQPLNQIFHHKSTGTQYYEKKLCLSVPCISLNKNFSFANADL